MCEATAWLFGTGVLGAKNEAHGTLQELGKQHF